MTYQSSEETKIPKLFYDIWRLRKSNNQIVGNGDFMIQILIKHRVNEYATWKNGFDKFAEFRKSSGEKAFRILHPADDPNNLTLLFDWDTQENAETFIASSELKSAMQEAGAAEAPKINFLNEVAQGSL